MSFFIESKHSGLVLDIEGGNVNPGSKVIQWQRKSHDHANQRWIFDGDFIASAADPNLVLDIEGGGGSESKIIVWPRKSGGDAWNQSWEVHNKIIRNKSKPKLVLDVKGGNKKGGAHIIVYKNQDSDNQKWKLHAHQEEQQQSAQISFSEPIQFQPQYSEPIQYQPQQPAYVPPPQPAYVPPPQPAYVPAPVQYDQSRSQYDHQTVWGGVDSILDQIIHMAASLKGHLGGATGQIDATLAAKLEALTRVHADIEAMRSQIQHSENGFGQDRSRLEHVIAQKEAEEKQKLAEYDARVHEAVAQKDRELQAAEAAKGDAAANQRKLNALLSDLEGDALSYSRLRPGKPRLDASEVDILRMLFLTSAVSESGKLSFNDLQKIVAKYEVSLPDGALKRLYQMVEDDTHGRMSYATLVAVSNDLVMLISDFKTLDVNSNGTLSRKEFRDHFNKLGFKSKEIVDLLFRFADEDDSDEVTFHEYVHLSVALLALRVLFTVADYDKTNTLTKEEVTELLQQAKIPPAAMAKYEHYFSIVDADNSRNLDYQEFVRLILSMFADA